MTHGRSLQSVDRVGSENREMCFVNAVGESCIQIWLDWSGPRTTHLGQGPVQHQGQHFVPVPKLDQTMHMEVYFASLLIAIPVCFYHHQDAF